MARFAPNEIDSYFFLDVVMVFLMINYSMPLAMIYFAMVLLGAFMYYVAVDSGFFRPIPYYKSTKNRFMPIVIGIALGFGFLWLYGLMQTIPFQEVFATTAFGESELIGKLVYAIFIPIAETRFFFRTMMQWVAWKINLPLNKSLFSVPSLMVIVFFSAIFTIFHATAKGVTNNAALMGTFMFGAISIILILYFKSLIEATVMHIVANAAGINLLSDLRNNLFGGNLLSNPWFLGAGAIGLVVYLKSQGRKLPIIG